MYRFARQTHKWTGIILSLFIVLSAVSGFLLLQKKNSTWLQPPTLQGVAGDIDDLITIPELFSIVLSENHSDFQSVSDIDRVDFRPQKHIFKVCSILNNSEVQVDAITGEILSQNIRRSDLIENIHDGSFFGETFYQILMPLVTAGLLWLVISGLIIWLRPIIKKMK